MLIITFSWNCDVLVYHENQDSPGRLPCHPWCWRWPWSYVHSQPNFWWLEILFSDIFLAGEFKLPLKRALRSLRLTGMWYFKLNIFYCLYSNLTRRCSQSGDKKKQLCLSLGATEFLDYREVDIVQAVKAKTTFGVHAVICTANGERAYEQSMQMLRPFSTLVCVGIPNKPFKLPATPFDMIVKGEFSDTYAIQNMSWSDQPIQVSLLSETPREQQMRWMKCWLWLWLVMWKRILTSLGWTISMMFWTAWSARRSMAEWSWESPNRWHSWHTSGLAYLFVLTVEKILLFLYLACCVFIVVLERGERLITQFKVNE